MSFRYFFALMLLVLSSPEAWAQKDDFQEYIDRYKALSVSEMERTGIPASIKLAQALLESDAGRSDLARKGNNHFGIKCGGDWNGPTFEKIDDETDVFGQPRHSCFRSYRSAEESFIAHSEFLTDPRKETRYGFLFELPLTDYKGWARGLKKAGYATSSSYSSRLIEIIERFDLNKLDQMTPEDLVAHHSRKDRRQEEEKQENPPAANNSDKEPDILPGARPSPAASGAARPAAAAIAYVNDVKYATALAKETVAALAERYKVSPRELIRYNENIESEGQVLPAGSRVFLQPKRSGFRGRQQWHTVSRGQTLLDISTTYGISLESLLQRNLLTIGVEPVAGSKIKLRGRNVSASPPVVKVDKINKPQIEIEEDSISAPGEHLDEIEGGQLKPVPDAVKPVTPAPMPAQPAAGPNNGDKEAAVQPDSSAVVKDPPPVQAPVIASATTEDATTYHTVQPGETLWRISQQYGTTVDSIKQLNNLKDNQIRSGMRLKVK